MREQMLGCGSGLGSSWLWVSGKRPRKGVGSEQVFHACSRVERLDEVSGGGWLGRWGDLRGGCISRAASMGHNATEGLALELGVLSKVSVLKLTRQTQYKE